MSDHGFVASLALILWVPISLALFSVMSPQKATLMTILGGMLFLPELAEFKFPLVPELNKHNIPYLCALLGCLYRCRRQVLRMPAERWFTLLVVIMCLGTIGTALTNGDVLRYGTWRVTIIRGLNLKDGLYVAAKAVLGIALPFFLGSTLFRSTKDLRALLSSFAIAALFYSLFALVEMRLSPQFHAWVYGYGQHSFDQTLRGGGYRPMVFMPHGLALGLFFAIATLSAAVLARSERRLLGLSTVAIAAYLFVVLLLCKSLGAFVYTLIGLPLIVYRTPRFKQRIAVVLAAIVLLYPALRAADLFPTGGLVSVANTLSFERGQSLKFRFDNEDVLLAKAKERMWFGWGEYNRNAVYDKDLGKSVSTTDGQWIIVFGIQGIVGFVTIFAMLLAPLFIAQKKLRLLRKQDQDCVAGFSIILAVAAVDLIPNALFDAYPYFLSGVLMGIVRTQAVAQTSRTRGASAAGQRPMVDPQRPPAAAAERIVS